MYGHIYSHLDFCNGPFTEIPKYQIDRLQRIQNRSASIVADVSHDQPSKEILRSQHWLPIHARVMFKILLLTFKTKCGTAPIYIRELFTTGQGRYRLRSIDENNFNNPRDRTKMADRSIHVAAIGPKWWNAHLKDS